MRGNRPSCHANKIVTPFSHHRQATVPSYTVLNWCYNPSSKRAGSVSYRPSSPLLRWRGGRTCRGSSSGAAYRYYSSSPALVTTVGLCKGLGSEFQKEKLSLLATIEMHPGLYSSFRTISFSSGSTKRKNIHSPSGTKKKGNNSLGGLPPPLIRGEKKRKLERECKIARTIVTGGGGGGDLVLVADLHRASVA